MNRRFYFRKKQAYDVHCDLEMASCPIVRLLRDDDIGYRISNTRQIQHVSFDSCHSLIEDKELDEIYAQIIKTTCKNCIKKKSEVQK